MHKCWIEFRLFHVRYVSNDYSNEHGNLGNKSYWHLMSPMIMVMEHGHLGNKSYWHPMSPIALIC